MHNARTLSPTTHTNTVLTQTVLKCQKTKTRQVTSTTAFYLPVKDSKLHHIYFHLETYTFEKRKKKEKKKKKDIYFECMRLICQRTVPEHNEQSLSTLITTSYFMSFSLQRDSEIYSVRGTSRQSNRAAETTRRERERESTLWVEAMKPRHSKPL